MKSILNKIKSLFKKEKLFFQDAFLNMMAFVIYIGSQQIVLFPLLAKLLDEVSYANIITFTTLMNAFCCFLGGQMGVTHQLQLDSYNGDEKKRNGDFLILMASASALIAVVFPIVLTVLKFDALCILFFTVTTLMSNFRLYIRFYFRVNSKYNHTICQNLFYLLGVGVGIGLYLVLKWMWLPLFLAEAFALTYTLFVIPKTKIKAKPSDNFPATAKRYAGLGSVDAMTNTVTLIDKLLIYPLLGSYPLAVYNAGTATSKVTDLVVNPLNEVILVKLSKAKEAGSGALWKTIILISLAVIAALFALSMPIIYVFTWVLYRQYLTDVVSIILLLSLACGIGTTASIMKSFIIRYAKSSQLMLCYALHIVCLAVGGYFGAKLYSVAGFAASVVLSKIELWVSFVITLRRALKVEKAQ